MSYPLQSTSRLSRSPLSLTIDQSDVSSSLATQNLSDSDHLLYDVLSSPSASPTINGHLASPTSPTRSGRSRSPGRRLSRTATSPHRTRSATPSEPAVSDLEAFSEFCRAWYFRQDEQAGQQMTHMLSSLPSSQRAQYSRIQAAIRSSYHQHVLAQRTAEFLALLSATQPGGSLMPHLRSDPNSLMAKKERKQRLERFIRSWCTLGLPGAVPFFQGLWGVMRLQSLPEKLGGAGESRVEWEIDDAVFMEAAGKDFMLEAIDVLKGVLGFEEVPNIRPSSSVSLLAGPFPSESDIHSRTQSQPLPNNTATSSTPVLASQKRVRAPSDPFMDTIPSVKRLSDSLPKAHRVFKTDLGVNEGSMRIWTTADLSNPEYLELLTLFPSFITRHTLPRFPVISKHDIEEGFDDSKQYSTVTVGTGTMWRSSRVRGSGWKGGWWTRFILWWKRLFS